MRIIFSFLLLAMTISCVHREEFHGRPFDFRDNVQKGQSAEQVIATLGSPSFISEIDGVRWYYIAERAEFSPIFFSSIPQEFLLLEIRLENNKVTDFELQKREIRSIPKFSGDTTKFGGNKSNVIKQVISNIGKYNPARK